MTIRYCLLVFVALSAMSSNVFAQPAYRCYSNDGKQSWFQNQPCASVTSGGSVLYKCVTPRGAISIQQQPCTGKSKTAWRRDVMSQSLSIADQNRLTRERMERDQDARELSRRAGTDRQPNAATYPLVAYSPPDKKSAQRAQCEQAKAERDTIERQIGLSISYDQLRALNDAVFVACNGL